MTIFWVCILKKFIEKKFFPKNAEILRIYKKNFFQKTPIFYEFYNL